MLRLDAHTFFTQSLIIIMRVIYIVPKNVKQTHRRSHCTSAKRMTSILRHVAEAFPPARQGTTLNSHRVIGIATNTSMALNCALVTGCSLTSNPGRMTLILPHGNRSSQFILNLDKAIGYYSRSYRLKLYSAVLPFYR